MRYFPLLLFAITATVNANAQSFDYAKDFKRISGETVKPTSKLFYDTLKNRFERDDKKLTNADLIALQIGFSEKEVYDPYGDLQLDRAFISSANWEDTDTTVLYGTHYLQKNPVSLSAHFALWKAYEKRKQAALAEKYKFRFQRLVDSILSTGDGTSKPYFVLSPIDGQILIRNYWNADIGVMGSSYDKNKNFLDVLEMKNPDGTSRTLYFVIQHAVKRMWKN